MVSQSGATVSLAISPVSVDANTKDKNGAGVLSTDLTAAAYTDGTDSWTLTAAEFPAEVLAAGALTYVKAIDPAGPTTHEFIGLFSSSSASTNLVINQIEWISADPAGNVASFAPDTGSGYGLSVEFESMRLVDRNGPSLEVGELTSGEVSVDRQETSIRSGFQQVTGQLGFELSHLSQDALIELATADPFATAGTGVTLATNAWDTSSVYTPGSGLTSLADLDAGDDGRYMRAVIYDATDNDSVIYSFIGLQEAGASISEIHKLGGERPENPLTADGDYKVSVETFDLSFVKKSSMKYATIVKDYPEIEVAQAFGGCTVNNLSFSVQPGNLVTGTADILGLEAKPMLGEGNAAGRYNYGEIAGFRNTVQANPGTVQGTTAYSPFASCLAIENAPNALCTGFDFTLNNNRETLPMLCTAFADNVYEGVANVTGTMTLLFENATEYAKFEDETESKIMITLSAGDASGDESMFFFFPRVRYSQPSFEIPTSGPVVLTLNFRALQADFGGEKTSCVIGRA